MRHAIYRKVGMRSPVIGAEYLQFHGGAKIQYSIHVGHGPITQIRHMPRAIGLAMAVENWKGIPFQLLQFPSAMRCLLRMDDRCKKAEHQGSWNARKHGKRYWT